MEQFAVYAHALVSLAGFAIVVLLMSPLCAILKEKAGIPPGATPESAYDNMAYRLNRAYLNGTETLAAFVAVTMVAILTGGDAWWVNVLASLVFLSRLVHIFVHLRGIGRPHRGPRTFVYVFGWGGMLGLAGIGICTVLFGGAA